MGALVIVAVFSISRQSSPKSERKAVVKVLLGGRIDSSGRYPTLGPARTAEEGGLPSRSGGARAVALGWGVTRAAGGRLEESIADLQRGIETRELVTDDGALPEVIAEIEVALSAALLGRPYRINLDPFLQWIDTGNSSASQLDGIWLLDQSNFLAIDERLASIVRSRCAGVVEGEVDLNEVYAIDHISEWLGFESCALVSSVPSEQWNAVDEEIGDIADGADAWIALVHLDSAAWLERKGHASLDLLRRLRSLAERAALDDLDGSYELTDLARSILASPLTRPLIIERVAGVPLDSALGLAYSRVFRPTAWDPAQSFALVDSRLLAGYPFAAGAFDIAKMSTFERWVLSAATTEVPPPEANSLAEVTQEQWESLGFVAQIAAARHAAAGRCELAVLRPMRTRRSRRADSFIMERCGATPPVGKFFSAAAVDDAVDFDYEHVLTLLDQCDQAAARRVTATLDGETEWLAERDAVGLWSLVVLDQIAAGKCDEVLAA